MRARAPWARCAGGARCALSQPPATADPTRPARVCVCVCACEQALSFQINDGEIIELSQRDCELPEEVQPWVLLGHPGDEVTISDIVDVC